MPKQKPNEQVQQIPLSEIRPFKNHPFKVTDDELMQQTIDSIMQVGVLNPAIIRPAPEGGYEMVAGHRRLHAADLAGLKTIPAIVRNLDDDEAVILMVDSNLQRETISPMERAQAYKMKMEALKHQGKRVDLEGKSTSVQVGQKLPGKTSRELVAENSPDSAAQIRRYIRLTELLPEVQKKVDSKEIAFSPAVELSYLTRDEQKQFLDAMDYSQNTPSLSQAQRLKKLSREGKCTQEAMRFATSFKANPQAAWSANAVLRILKNPVYTGILIQGKETTPSYKVRKRVTKPETEWAVVPDTHEAIIERRDFDSVQKALSLDTRRSPGDSAVQLFSGMVFCGECGASMVRKTVPSGKKKYVYYVCSAHKQDKSCSPHRMRDEALEQLVLDTVKQYIRDVVDLDDILAMTDTAPLRTAEAQKVQRQLDKKRSEHERLQKLLMSLYESLADGIIDRDEYARLKQNYAGRCAECEKQMDALQETLTQIREHGGEHREWMAQFRKHLNITELERSIVVALIDRILIYRDNRVEVRFRFADEFAWQTDILRRAQIREVV